MECARFTGALDWTVSKAQMRRGAGNPERRWSARTPCAGAFV